MIKIWGRNTSVNVQKVMWATGELDLPHERVDVGGSFGKNKEPAYLAMNPNGLVPTLEEDGFFLWESNSIVRYLAAKYGPGKLEPSDFHERARASSWMDWQLSVAAPAIFGMFWGLIRTPPEKRDHAAIDASRDKTTAAMKILDAQLAKTPSSPATHCPWATSPSRSWPIASAGWCLSDPDSTTWSAGSAASSSAPLSRSTYSRSPSSKSLTAARPATASALRPADPPPRG